MADTLQQLKAFVRSQGWRWSTGKPIQHGEQIIVTDGSYQAVVTFYPKRSKLILGGADSPLKKSLTEWQTGASLPTTRQEISLPEAPSGNRLDALKAYITEQGWNWGPGAHIDYGEQIVVSDAGVTALVNFWPKRGKMQVQGDNSSLKASLQTWINGGHEPASTAQPFTAAHIGMDESGKGDWYGPLVVAAVYADERTQALLQQAGVRDSKMLDEHTLFQLADVITRIIPTDQRIVCILLPDEYNRRYETYQNINILLAAVYAETAKEIWQTTRADLIVCDQFSQKADRLEQAFAEQGVPAPVQQHHAESSSVVVAAASILATVAFSEALVQLGAQADLDGSLPKGSSDVETLKAVGHMIIRSHGQEQFGHFAKLHFKPIQKLLQGTGTSHQQLVQESSRTRQESSVTICQSCWQMQKHDAGGYYRFKFADGGILDWYVDYNGKLDVRGDANAPSYQQLITTAHGKIMKPGATPEENHGKLERLQNRLDELFPPTKTLPCVFGIGLRSTPTVQGMRFDFTDGGVLHYHQSTGRLLIQGTPENQTRQALEELKALSHAGLDALQEHLRVLFPDWQTYPQTEEEMNQENDTIWKANVNALDWQRFWPKAVDFRQAASAETVPSQRAMFEDWSSVLMHQRKKALLAQAPTGLGKTMAALVPALAWIAQTPDQRCLYYLVNRVTQHENPLRELRNHLAEIFHINTGQELRVVDVIGRSKLCIKPDTKRISEQCKQSRDEASFDNLPGGICSWQEVRDHLENQQCPYHTLQGLMKDAHVVICDYWWFFGQVYRNREQLASLDGRNPTRRIIIVDEAHNLPLRVRSELDVDVPVSRLQNELQALPENARACLETLLKAIQQYAPDEGIAPGELLAIQDAGAIRATLTTIADADDGDRHMTSSERLLRLLLEKDTAVVIYHSDRDDEQHLIGRLVDPTKALQEGYNQAAANLTMSGTLAAPSDSSEELRYQVPLFGLAARSVDETVTRTYASPFPLRNQRWIYCPDTLGTYRYRDEYVPRYAEHVCTIGRATPGVTAVFFSSYAFLQQVQQAITNNTEQSLIIAEAQSRHEDETSEQTGINDYHRRLKALVQQHGRAYLFAVYQGRIAEGADFGGNLIKTVVCVSLPLEYPELFHERLQQLYEQLFDSIARDRADKLEEKAREYAMRRIALSLVLQACGRGIRSGTDRCAFVLLDRRYGPASNSSVGYDWRGYLEPRPYNVKDPAYAVQMFHATRTQSGQSTWDSVLLNACKREES